MEFEVFTTSAVTNTVLWYVTSSDTLLHWKRGLLMPLNCLYNPKNVLGFSSQNEVIFKYQVFPCSELIVIKWRRVVGWTYSCMNSNLNTRWRRVVIFAPHSPHPWWSNLLVSFNHFTPNGQFSGRTAPLTYRCCIFYLFNRYMYWIF